MADVRLSDVRSILVEITGIPPHDRAAFLDGACGDDVDLRREVESLLAQDANDLSIVNSGRIFDVFGMHDGSELLEELAESEPRNVGPYRIRGVLGEGGMGVVYHAVQETPIQREVALKLLRQGVAAPGLVARFESERQTLAMMDHPNIAKVLDADTDELGRPYFVMEIVHGAPITRYCERNHLSTRARVQLLQDICRAVAHAHQKGIIHRDLKPSNLLVSQVDGQATPKVIDFGIAKALEDSAADGLTQEGQPIGTIRYMSPEQLKGQIRHVDTRSDVYALGVVAYEVLSGEHPFEVENSGPVGQLEAIETSTPKPFPYPPRRRSSQRRRPRNDRENGTEPGTGVEIPGRSGAIRRPGAVPHVASHTGPPPSTIYHVRKWVSRHKATASLVAAFVALSVGVGAVMSVLYTRSEANLRRAIAAESEASGVSEFMTGMFEISDPNRTTGETVTAREILDTGAARIERDLAEQPIVQARLMRTMGMAYRGLGIYDEAERLLTSAQERLDRASAPNAPPSELDADILNELARVLERQGKLQEAAQIHRGSLDIKRTLFGPDHPKYASSLSNLGGTLFQLGHTEEAQTYLKEAVAIFERTSPGTLELSAAMDQLARTYMDQVEYEAAEDLYLRSLRVREEALDPADREIATALNNLFVLYSRMGRLAEAEPLARRATSIWEKVYGHDHPEYAAAVMNMATMYDDWGQPDKAERLYLEAMEIQERVLGPDHMDIAIAANNLGLLYRANDRLDEAEPCWSVPFRFAESHWGTNTVACPRL